MKNFTIFIHQLLLAFSLFISSLQTHSDEATGSSMGINLSPATVEDTLVRLTAKGSADPSNMMLRIDLKIENLSEAVMEIAPESVQIATEQGWRASPTDVRNNSKKNQLSIDKKSHANFSLDISPINSMALYQLIQFKGDFESNYILRLSFSNNPKEYHIPVTLDKSDYTRYIATQSIEPQLQVLVPEIDSEIFSAQQKEHYEKFLESIYPDISSVVPLSEQQVISGVAFQWRMYNENGKFVVALKMKNNNRQDIVINSQDILIKEGTDSYRPKNNFTQVPNAIINTIINNTDVDLHTVKPGDRFLWKFIYDLKPKSSELALDLGGIRVQGIPLYANPLGFAAADRQW